MITNWMLAAGAAWAQAEAAQVAPKGPSMLEIIGMPLGFLAIMYFFIIRPQQSKMREQNQMISNLKAGDEVVTSGGIIGRVRSVAEGFITLEIANNTAIKVMKANITGFTKNATGTEKQAKA